MPVNALRTADSTAGVSAGRWRLWRRRNCRCRDELRLRFFEQLFLFRIKFGVFGGSNVVLCSIEFVSLDEHQRDVNGCVGIVQPLRRQTLDNGESLCISGKAMK
jgi:hypothetical protein